MFYPSLWSLDSASPHLLVKRVIMEFHSNEGSLKEWYPSYWDNGWYCGGSIWPDLISSVYIMNKCRMDIYIHVRGLTDLNVSITLEAFNGFWVSLWTQNHWNSYFCFFSEGCTASMENGHVHILKSYFQWMFFNDFWRKLLQITLFTEQPVQ